MSWKTRMSGTSRQRGTHFRASKGASYVKPSMATYAIPQRTVHLRFVNVNPSELIPTEDSADVEKRADHFEDMIKQGQTVAPILVHKDESGRFKFWTARKSTSL